MFSCDLRLDYLIFSLWCSSTSNHLLNGWNRHDDSVNGPWCSGLLSRHALHGTFHSLPCIHLERPQFNLQVFPLNFRFISNAPRCISTLMWPGTLNSASLKQNPWLSSPWPQIHLFHNLSKLPRLMVSPGTQLPKLNPQKHPWLFLLPHPPHPAHH